MGICGQLLAVATIAGWMAAELVPPASAQQATKEAVKPAQAPPPPAAKTDAKKNAPAAAAPAAGPAAAAGPPMPSTMQLTLLIQNAMAAVSQANMTGNYSVLHALAAPSFQQVNPPEKLSQLFEGLRKARLDITPVLLFRPVLTTHPAIDGNGMLRMTGYYQTAPQNVLFDLLFVPYAGQWRLQGLSINTRPDQKAANQPPQPTAAKPGTQPAAKK